MTETIPTTPSQLADVYTEEEIRQRFRFTRRSINIICNLVHDYLVRPTQRNQALSVETQVMAGLRYLASGSFQSVVGYIVAVTSLNICVCL